MPVLVRANDVSAETRDGVRRTALLTPGNTGSDKIVLERLGLSAGRTLELRPGEGAIGWLQVLSGQGMIDSAPAGASTLSYLGLGAALRLDAEAAMSLLWAVVPEAARFDPALPASSPDAILIDWSREPVLQSEHDARRRVYMATPKLIGTKALKGEMIIYPPGTKASNHHHEGAEHFQYVVSGSGTAVLDGTPETLSAGDTLYNYEHEPHYFFNASEADFVFVEFFVPGECKTVWAPGAEVCAWLPTGKDSKGEAPVREIAYHVHGEDSGI
ncbi:MAG: cupin domain-containing protein [Alphaproteobacteria bacterium]|nr:cupin domain-containing protein [Alphaproteobacteria bacterium]